MRLDSDQGEAPAQQGLQTAQEHSKVAPRGQRDEEKTNSFLSFLDLFRFLLPYFNIFSL